MNNVVSDEHVTIMSVSLLLLMPVSSFEVSTCFTISSSGEVEISMLEDIAIPQWNGNCQNNILFVDPGGFCISGKLE